MEQIIVLKKNKLLSDMEKKILIKKKTHRLDQMVVAGFDLLGIFP